MGSTPGYKVYDAAGVYQAAARDTVIAAGVIGAVGGLGWTVKFNGRIVYRDGEHVFAADSIDRAADLMDRTIASHRSERMAKYDGLREINAGVIRRLETGA